MFVLIHVKLAPKSNEWDVDADAARQLVSSKGLYINNTPVADVQQKLTPADFIDGRLAFLRAGNHKLAVIVVR